MPLLFLFPIVGLASLFVGSQIDDAVEAKFKPVGGGTDKGLPLSIKIPLLVAGGTAAFIVVRKLIK